MSSYTNKSSHKENSKKKNHSNFVLNVVQLCFTAMSCLGQRVVYKCKSMYIENIENIVCEYILTRISSIPYLKYLRPKVFRIRIFFGIWDICIYVKWDTLGVVSKSKEEIRLNIILYNIFSNFGHKNKVSLCGISTCDVILKLEKFWILKHFVFCFFELGMLNVCVCVNVRVHVCMHACMCVGSWYACVSSSKQPEHMYYRRNDTGLRRLASLNRILSRQFLTLVRNN
jgi:hypothetical protein